MDINTLIEFPGILITIGVGLILISIIIIIIAYRSETKAVDATSLSIYNNENNIQQPNEENNIMPITNIEETPKEEPEPYNVPTNMGINDVMNNNANATKNENITQTEEKEEPVNTIENNEKIEIPLVDANIANIEEPEKEDITEVLPTINAFDLEFNNTEYNKEIKKEEIIKEPIKPKEEPIEKKEEQEEEDIELL